MLRIIDLSADDARSHFLKGSSYFNSSIPDYIGFEPILEKVESVIGTDSFMGYKNNKHPRDYPDVNYKFTANKDGRFAWRPYELIHPAIYVSLVNSICDSGNWDFIVERFGEFESTAVDCCSVPVVSQDEQTDVATQIRSWWQKTEQQSLIYSLEFSHILYTDVVDCYGSLYTHSIPQALHGVEKAKRDRQDRSLIGNQIDLHVQAGRYGQTNGISQGSVLMDFIAEMVLGYVDIVITTKLVEESHFRILRYRDDYKIFTNNDDQAERILKAISDSLQTVGMKLGVAKTEMSRNIVEGSIKADKLAGIDLQDLGKTNAKTIQKQLLRLHSFGRKFPNSGALRRLLSDFYNKVAKQKKQSEDLEVQVAIATDIAFVSPTTIPAIAAILSHLIALADDDDKHNLWTKVRNKMRRVPYNGYLEIWMQRVTQPDAVGLPFESDEPFCRIVNGEDVDLWENNWIASQNLLSALNVSQIAVGSVADAPELVQPNEVELFKQRAWEY